MSSTDDSQQHHEFAGASGDALEANWQGHVQTGFWSLSDQGTVSLGNFATTCLLGRNLPPAQFGAYGVVLGAMLFLNNIQGSLINYPLSVAGAAGNTARLRKLTGLSLLLTLAMLLPMAVGATVATAAVKWVALAPWVLAALLLWQLQETLRRALLAHLRHRDAIWGDALSYLGQAGVIALLIHQHALTLPAVFGTIAATSLLAAALQWAQLRPTFASPTALLERARECWSLGRWTALCNLAGVVNVQVVLWTLASAHGNAEAAKLLAMGTILGITHPALFSVGNLIIPAVAKTSQHLGTVVASRLALIYGALGALLVVPFYVLLALFPRLALQKFYGAASPYIALQWPLRLFAFAYVMSYVATVQSALFNGLSRPRSALAIQVVTVVGTVLLTLPLAITGGVLWSLAGACISTFLGVIAGFVLLGRRSVPVTQKFSIADRSARASAAAA